MTHRVQHNVDTQVDSVVDFVDFVDLSDANATKNQIAPCLLHVL